MEKQTETNKQDNLQEGQPTCVACQSRRMQLVLIKQQPDITTLTLLCLTCGNITMFDLKGNIQIDQQANIQTTKPSPNYTG